MASTNTPNPGAQFSLGDRLEEIDTILYRMQHTCGLLGDFAGQHGPRAFTDGMRLEMFAVVFGSISDQVRDVRDRFQEIRKEQIS